EEHSLDPEDIRSYEHEGQRLNSRQDKQDGYLRQDIAAPAQVKKSFTLEYLPVADDLFSAYSQSHEQRNDNTHEQVSRQIQVLAVQVSAKDLIIDVVIPD